MLSRRMPIKGSHTRSWPRTKRPLAGPSGSAMERRRAAGRQQGVQPGEVASSYSSPQAVGPCPSLPHTAAHGTGTQNHLEQRGPGVASRALIPPGAQLAPIDHWRRGPIPPLLWAPSRQLCFRPGFHEGGSVHVWLWALPMAMRIPWGTPPDLAPQTAPLPPAQETPTPPGRPPGSGSICGVLYPQEHGAPLPGAPEPSVPADPGEFSPPHPRASCAGTRPFPDGLTPGPSVPGGVEPNPGLLLPSQSPHNLPRQVQLGSFPTSGSGPHRP